MKKSAPDSTVAINRIWSQVLACLGWTPILQKEFEPLSTLLYQTLVDCLMQVLRLTKGTLFGICRKEYLVLISHTLLLCPFRI